MDPDDAVDPDLDSAFPEPVDALERRLCLAEAVLVAYRLDGSLAAADYRDGMAQLAARDAIRNPMVVPPEQFT